MTPEDNKSRIRLRWFGLLFINLLFFNSPAGSCSDKISTGFPFPFYSTAEQHPVSQDFILLAVDSAFCLTILYFIYIFLKKHSFSLTSKIAAKATLIYATLANLICVTVLTTSIQAPFADIIIYVGWPFYYPGLILLVFLGYSNSPDYTSNCFRVLLIPTLVIFFSIFYVITFLIRFLKKQN